MSLFRKRGRAPKPELNRQEAMAFRPVVSREIAAERMDSGLMRLRYPVAFRPWFSGLARRLGQAENKPMQRILELDEMGSTAWAWLDGQRSVRELAVLLAERYGLHQREAEVSMAAFLRELGRRGIIAMVR